MSGFTDRDGAEIQSMREWLRIGMEGGAKGTVDCVMRDRILKTLDGLVAFKRDHSPALIRKDEIIQELREQVEKLERTAHALRQARISNAAN